MQKWEYLDVIVGKNENYTSIERLDAAGQEGWEFTGLMEETHHVKIYIMKRPIKTEEEKGLNPVTSFLAKHDHTVARKCGGFCPMRGTIHEIVGV